MENLSNLRTLAETAYESKNFEQAYSYYSRLLEIDPSDATAWVGKGLSAGWISAPGNVRLDELMVSLRQALQNGLSDQERERVADESISAAESYIRKAEVAFNDGVREFDKKEIADGVLLSIHNLGRLSYQMDHGNRQTSGRIKALEVMKYACEISPSAERYKKSIYELDKLLQHSQQNVNYIEGHKDAGDRHSRLMQERQQMMQRAKDLDPNFAVQPTSNGGGCFIATATLGDYNHPYVIELRRFRDEELLPSAMGRIFVRAYYKLSPPVAEVIEKHPRLRSLSLHLLIRPIVERIRK